ncbi:hypothetical protein Lal_00043484 [Lupinus albus]|nr:hypothetical protein Lal_00043484 [Lupinus albus]
MTPSCCLNRPTPGGLLAPVGTVTSFRSSRIASSAYQNGPLGSRFRGLNEAATPSYLFKVENSRGRCAPMPLIIGFTR